MILNWHTTTMKLQTQTSPDITQTTYIQFQQQNEKPSRRSQTQPTS